LGNILKEQRNRENALRSTTIKQAELPIYDPWNILVGDPTFLLNFSLGYSHTRNFVSIDSHIENNNQLNLEIHVPSHVADGSAGDADLFEYPLGGAVTHFSAYTREFEGLCSGGLGIYYSFAVELPKDFRIKSLDKISYVDQYVSYEYPKESVNYLEDQGKYYIVLSEIYPKPGEFVYDLCKIKTYPPRDFTIVFNLERSLNNSKFTREFSN